MTWSASLVLAVVASAAGAAGQTCPPHEFGVDYSPGHHTHHRQGVPDAPGCALECKGLRQPFFTFGHAHPWLGHCWCKAAVGDRQSRGFLTSGPACHSVARMALEHRRFGARAPRFLHARFNWSGNRKLFNLQLGEPQMWSLEPMLDHNGRIFCYITIAGPGGARHFLGRGADFGQGYGVNTLSTYDDGSGAQRWELLTLEGHRDGDREFQQPYFRLATIACPASHHLWSRVSDPDRLVCAHRGGGLGSWLIRSLLHGDSASFFLTVDRRVSIIGSRLVVSNRPDTVNQVWRALAQ